MWSLKPFNNQKLKKTTPEIYLLFVGGRKLAELGSQNALALAKALIIFLFKGFIF